MRAEELKTIGDAVFVRLTQDKARRSFFTLIDQEDFERVVRSRWSFRQGYARATNCKYLPKHHMRLHAFVLKAEPGQIIDHISGDRLDNRKQNLRIVSAAENAKNAKRQTFPGKTSRFKGVCWSRHNALWAARIASDGVGHWLGLFGAEDDAARAYDEAALRLHKEFARTNATMKLYEMEDPFIPDCSVGLEASRRTRVKSPFLPKHEYIDHHRRRTYDQRLDEYCQRVIGNSQT